MLFTISYCYITYIFNANNIYTSLSIKGESNIHYYTTLMVVLRSWVVNDPKDCSANGYGKLNNATH